MLTTIRQYLDSIARVLDELETGGVTGADLSRFDITEHLANALSEAETCQEIVDSRPDVAAQVIAAGGYTNAWPTKK